jgi:xanthine/uracil permease
MKFTSGLVFSGLLASASAVPIASGPSGKWFDRMFNFSLSIDLNYILIYVLGFVVIVMENTNKATALADPYYRQLADSGVLLNGYQGKNQ